MILLQMPLLLLVAVGGTAVVLTRDPKHQAIVLSFHGLLLALLFFVLQAPDVALSEVAVSAVIVPLMMLMTLARVRKRPE
jgi:uncharacterized MnhB-related membrane protein